MILTTKEDTGLYLKIRDNMLLPCDKDGNEIGGALAVELFENIDELTTTTITFYVAGFVK